MTTAEYEKVQTLDRERFMECPKCGEVLSLEELLLHLACECEFVGCFIAKPPSAQWGSEIYRIRAAGNPFADRYVQNEPRSE